MPSSNDTDFRNLKQREVAAAFGVTPKTVQNWTKRGLPRLDEGGYSLPACILWYGTHCDRDGVVIGGYTD
jgi:phage terminase Nu1 subunit (DNA packaging protein)